MGKVLATMPQDQPVNQLTKLYIVMLLLKQHLILVGLENFQNLRISSPIKKQPFEACF
jgi:hypothetical protein